MSAIDWPTLPLAEVATINPGPSRQTSPDSQVTFIPMSAVGEETGTIDTTQHRPYGAVRRGFRPVMDGDVLFAKITPSMENGKAAVAQGLNEGLGVASTEFHVLRPLDGLDAEFLRYWLSQRSFRSEARRHMSGTAGQLRVPASYLRQIRIPVPSVAAQKQTVALIEQQLTRLESGRVLLQNLLVGLERIRQSVFQAAVRGMLAENEAVLARRESRTYESANDFLLRVGLTRPLGFKRTSVEQTARPEGAHALLPEGWALASMLDLGHLGRGKSRHRPRNDPRILGGPYPFIQTGDVRRSGGMITEYSATYNDAGLAQSYLWPSGTLCITIAANIADTGILAFPACFPDSVVGFVHDGHPATTRYVEYCLRAMKQRLWALAPATAQKNINLDTLRDIRLPMPPLAEQIRIVDQVERLTSLADSVRSVTEVALLRSDHLRSGILRAGLSGRLLDEDMNIVR